METDAEESEDDEDCEPQQENEMDDQYLRAVQKAR